MRRLALLVVISLAGCAIIPPTPPDPILQEIIREVFYSTVPDPSGTHAPPAPHSCQIVVEPADPSGHAPYSTVDPIWSANGWLFWVACVVSGRDLGRSLPSLKITGDANEPTMTPVLGFRLDTAPIFGRGSGHYANPAAQNISIWRRAYVQSYG